MDYINLELAGCPLSRIAFGCCNPILINDDYNSEKLLDMAFAEGINVFDTAKVYGKSEEIIGRWLSNTGNRERVVIISKGCHPDDNNRSRVNTEDLKTDIDSSLSRLGTDYIDIYMLHRDDSDADMGAMIATLNDYIRQGVIRRIGVSNWKHNRIEQINRLAESMGLIGFTVSSPQFSLAKQVGDPWGGGCVSISWDEDALRWYRSHKEIVIFSYSSLAHGFFSGKISSSRLISGYMKLDYAARKGYWCRDNINTLRIVEKLAQEKGCTVAQISLSWCISQGLSIMPIVTASSLERIRENIGALSVCLSTYDLKRIGGLYHA